MSVTVNEQRTIGRLEAKIETLEKQQAAIMTELKQISGTLAEAKGGWKTLIAVGAIAGSAGAIIGKFAPFFGFLPR